MSDHIHLFVSAYPTITVHKLVKEFKGVSFCILFKESPYLLKLPSFNANMWLKFFRTLYNLAVKQRILV